MESKVEYSDGTIKTYKAKQTHTIVRQLFPFSCSFQKKNWPNNRLAPPLENGDVNKRLKMIRENFICYKKCFKAVVCEKFLKVS